MKKINVIVKDKTILELVEDGNKGDLIDLKELVQVDMSYLESIIESGKDKLYASKLDEYKKVYDANKKVEIEKLNNQLELLKQNHLSSLKEKEHEISKLYEGKIVELEKKISELIVNKQAELDSLTSKKNTEINNLKYEKDYEYMQLKQNYDVLNTNFNDKLKQNTLELENRYSKQINDLNSALLLQKEQNKLQIEQELNKLKEKYEEELKNKDATINNLQRAKALMNVKQTGEDLEAWCDNEVISYMQNGLYNCTWTKDNIVVKDENDTKGSKADYIFNIYASNNHLKEELLASVCLDMKDENPDSINKKSNSDYYKQLDKNRIKKNCKYALLVSNLEMDKPNILPIFKVREYENMYVVRPAYLMVFLNMLTSLTTRFADLVINNEIEKLNLQSKFDLIEQFNEIKNTYLDKPLLSLQKNIETITNNATTIKNACKNIDDQCENIKNNYINKIIEKLNKFQIKLDKTYK